jgi:hypothetical protein
MIKFLPLRKILDTFKTLSYERTIKTLTCYQRFY